MTELNATHTTTSQIILPARDDYPLGATVYEPGAARGTVVVFAATGVRQRFYDKFARHLAERGHRVVTFDYRGIGRSRPQVLRGFEASMTDWAALDAGGAVDFVRSRYGDSPFAIVGHSFGGQLVGILDEASAAAASVLVGAQLGYFGHWSLPRRAAYGALWKVAVPAAVTLFGYLPGELGLGEDLPGGVAREWARWCSHPEYLAGYHADAAARFARFRPSTLLLSASDDTLAPPQAVRALAKLLPRESLVERVLRPELLGRNIGHFGFFRPDVGESLWPHIGRFVEEAFAGRPGTFDLGQPPSIDVIMPSSEEILADLNYGRT